VHADPSRNGTRVAVFGAYGHTGRFVVTEMRRRGWTPVPCGRDAAALAAQFAAGEWRCASVDDPASLDRALAGTGAVINCAGPFLDTAPAVLQAALRARIHYLDVSAEQPAVRDVFERFDVAAREAGIAVLPAMAFYGGLADLLATAAMSDWPQADRIDVAVALDSWHPTRGTRITGQRNTARRVVVAEGGLQLLADPPPTRTWAFPPPFDTQDVVALPLAETITIAHHLKAAQIASWMNLAPLRDLRDAATPAPVAVDASGRSAQRFALDVIVTRHGATRRAIAQGCDIYAITAPLVVEALERVLDGRARAPGAHSAGSAFDAREFLAALARRHPELVEHVALQDRGTQARRGDSWRQRA
jgi:hypothetical protein